MSDNDYSNLQNLVGKTISKVDTSSANVVYLEFSDGTNIVLDTESLGWGLVGICGMDPADYGDSYSKL